MSLVGMCT